MLGCGRKCRNPFNPNTRKMSPRMILAAWTALFFMVRLLLPNPMLLLKKKLLPKYSFPPAAQRHTARGGRSSSVVRDVPCRHGCAREALERHDHGRPRGGAPPFQRDRGPHRG